MDWPLLTDVGVHFWHNVHGNRRVYCIGNLFSYALALVGVVMTIIPFKSQRWVTAIRFAVGWAVSYFPFFLVPRTMFLYHYLIPLMFGALAYGAALDMWFKNKKVRGLVALISIGLVIFGFMCYGRYAYARPSTDLMYKMSPSVWFEGSKTRDKFVDRMTKLQNDYENSDTDRQELKNFKKIREAGGEDL
jgi:dolichyl-phosphate-mannose--protein O-mannosyl transferase